MDEQEDGATPPSEELKTEEKPEGAEKDEKPATPTPEQKEWQRVVRPPQQKRGRKWIYAVIVAFVAGLVAFNFSGLTGYFTAKTEVPAVPGLEKVKAGDTVKVWYTGKLEDGKVFDTNVQGVALLSGIQREVFEPLEFQIGSGGMIPGFEEAVIGMRIGDRKTVTIPPEKGYPFDPTKIISVPLDSFSQEINRTNNISVVAEWPLENFRMFFGREPVANDVVNATPPFFLVPYRVTQINATTVTLRENANLREGMKFSSFPFPWDSTVISIKDNVATIRYDPEDGQTIETPIGNATIRVTKDTLLISTLPEVGKRFTYLFNTVLVKDMNETSVTLDFNSELAGKTLIFEIELVALNRTAGTAAVPGPVGPV